MAKNKCKNCGYRFKRDDGAICPECLSSREDTMDCEDFSSDLHSHEEGFFGQREEMSDAQKQLEQERFQNAVDKAKRSGNSQHFGSRSTTFNPKTSSVNYTYTSTTNPNATPNFRIYPMSNGQYMNNVAGKVEKARKRVRIIIICMIVVMIISAICSGIFRAIEDNSGYYDDSYVYRDIEQETFFSTEIYTDDYTIAFYQPSVVVYDLKGVIDEYDSDDYVIIEVPVLVRSQSQYDIMSSDILLNMEVDCLSFYDEFLPCLKLDEANTDFAITTYQTAYYSYFFVVEKSDAYRLVFNDSTYGQTVHYTIDFELDFEQNAKEDI